MNFAVRLSLVVLSTLVLCSCRAAPPQQQAQLPRAAQPSLAPPSPALMQYAKAHPSNCSCCSGGACANGAACAPAACAPCMACRGISGDEFLCDGGDAPPGVLVSPEWQVYGLDSTDAIAHFDTLDGRTIVEPSNRVCVYAPRFGAVRVVTRLVENEQVDVIEGANQPLRLARHDDVLIPNTGTQNLQPIGDIGVRMPEGFVNRQHEGLAQVTIVPRAVQDALLPYENLQIIRLGQFDNREKAKLIEAVDAAIVWSNVQAPQVQLDNVQAQVMENGQKAQLTYTVDLPTCPKLRLVKVASTPMANPGDFVDFTLRFDNVGDQPIGNVVILDDLTTRLEYVADSAQASVDAKFSTSPNENGSLVLRWEVTKPLLPCEGGIVKFRTRVR